MASQSVFSATDGSLSLRVSNGHIPLDSMIPQTDTKVNSFNKKFENRREKTYYNIFISVDKAGVIWYNILIKPIKGESLMQETQIKLFTIQEVREFVNLVILVDFEVDLMQGRYIIDAKSIMGIFSLDLLSPITVRAHSDNAASFFEKISKFKA